jgi:CheY-like chemotaxis protein
VLENLDFFYLLFVLLILTVRVFKKMLATIGYKLDNADVASDGLEALKLLQERPFDIVLIH